MIRQVLVSLVIVAAAIVGYVVLVPGAPAQLAKFGISLPIAAPAEGNAPAAAQAPAGNTPRATGAGGGNASASGGSPGGGNPGGGAGGPGGGGRGGNRTLVVVTSPVVMATINDKLTAIGDSQAAHSVTVMSPASGTLTELLVQARRPGQRPARCSGTSIPMPRQIAYERALLASEGCAGGTRPAPRNWPRPTTPPPCRSTPRNWRPTTPTSRCRTADLDLKRRTITTPIAGTVGLFQVNPGNTVTSQTVVTTIEDTSHILVSFWVPERYADLDQGRACR